ncbi:hypothetical protein AVEN_124843-1 [Araneus ventricosus]|uniref:Uncharacterized protein n=1 Tax=Araneus ventricosus TaxID=182803 RepID=A0A4Y2UM10_ARAVE|nr:hypothetical protein AVEN_124843-1 [Araneus ventricosus]
MWWTKCYWRLPVVGILILVLFADATTSKSGAISFDDTFTVNGLRCITFQQACQSMDFFEVTSSGSEDALNDTAQFQSPRQLRHAVRVNDLWLWEQRRMFQIYGCNISFTFVRTLCIVILEVTGPPHYALADIEELLTSEFKSPKTASTQL